jgi:hypothetical protein
VVRGAVYVDSGKNGAPAAQVQTDQVVLRGSVSGLTPDQAVDVVLVSTTLRVERTAGRLTIGD